jgi:dsRNA-specific ribonuclease
VAVKSTGGKELGSGSGPSKKAAEMNAAAHALLQLKSEET